MFEAVGQRFRHARDAAVRVGIARCHNGPAVGEAVFADLPIERQLQAGILHQLWRAVQFVEEEHPLAVAWQEVGDCPMGAPVAVDMRQPADVDGVEKHGANIDQLAAEPFGDLLHHSRFADASIAGQKSRHLDAEQQFQGIHYIGGFHFVFPCACGGVK
jgi:hypothetical protein